MDTFTRFSAKVEKYIKYRWDYEPQAIDQIFDITQLTNDAVVADIGSGTGALAQLFVNRAKQVFAIEPNPKMRAIAEENLRTYPSFFSIDALADSTGLADQSVDLITVGRAIHWFPDQTTRAEFQRILKPNGWLAIMSTPCLNQEILDAIKTLKVEENGWDIKGDKYTFNSLDSVKLNFYYGHDHILNFRVEDIKQETWDEFIGRLRSLSTSPEPEHPLYSNFENAARAIFNRFSADGDRLVLNVATLVYLGQIH